MSVIPLKNRSTDIGEPTRGGGGKSAGSDMESEAR
jgi:hypothetical protein